MKILFVSLSQMNSDLYRKKNAIRLPKSRHQKKSRDVQAKEEQNVQISTLKNTIIPWKDLDK